MEKEENNIELNEQSAEGMQGEEEFDPESIDKEEVIDALLSDDDERLFELLKGFNASHEEILSLKKELLDKLKKALFDEDLAEIKANYREIDVDDITKLPNFGKFAVLRSEGLTAVEAFEGANPEYLDDKSDYKREYFNTGKLRGKPKGELPIPEKDIRMWKSAFPKDSDEELTKRYNRAIRA